MSKRLMVLSTSLASLFLCTPRPALALWPLPWCFEMPPYSDIFILNVKPTGNNQRSGSGRDTTDDPKGERVVSATAFLNAGVLQLGLTIFPIPGFYPVTVEARVDPNTGVGAGTCRLDVFPTKSVKTDACGPAIQRFSRIVCPGAVDSAAVAKLSAVAPTGLAAGAIPSRFLQKNSRAGS